MIRTQSILLTLAPGVIAGIAARAGGDATVNTLAAAIKPIGEM